MRRVERLIDSSRRFTENVDFSDSTGISTEDFVRLLNDAQRRIESKINALHNRAFTKTTTITVNSSTEDVTLPTDMYMNSRLIHVEYNPSSGNNFYTLKKAQTQERITEIIGEPSFYIRLEDKIILQPGSQSGGQVRLTYQRRLPRLDIRRGVLSAQTSTSSEVTALTIDPASTDPVFDRDELLEDNFLCVVDRAGNIKTRGIEFDTISVAGVVTITGGSSAIEDGDSQPAVGDYVVSGDVTSNVSDLPPICERYLLQYCDWKIFKKDSNIDSSEALMELQQIEDDIVSAYTEAETDVDYVTILDSTYLDPEDEVF